MTRSLRVMTFNIHHARGMDGRLDLERIAAVIGGQTPDVAALQEVDRHFSDRSDLADQAGWLAERLGADLAYGANIDLDPDRPGRPRRRYGTAILSRHPILDWDNRRLPGTREPRGLLRAAIEPYGSRVRLYNTHLEMGDAAERLEQALVIAETIGEGPCVLMGDLNATSDRPEIAPLLKVLADTGDDTRTHRSGRIDYVLTTRDITVTRRTVVDTEPAASDHLPVVCDLTLPSP